MKTLFLLLALSLNAWATDGDHIFAHDHRNLFEVDGGYESERMDFTIPGSGRDGSPDHSTYTDRSGPRVALRFENLDLNYLAKQDGDFNLVFLPAYIVADPGNTETESFSQAPNGGKPKKTWIRKFIGALIQGRYDSESGRVFVRGKVASVEYDRDRGLWNWRVIDANIGVRQIQKLPGQALLSLEASVGAGVGGFKLFNLDDLEKALSLQPVSASFAAVMPYAQLGAEVLTERIRMEVSSRVEKRFDISRPGESPTYFGHTASVSSLSVVSQIDVEAKIARVDSSWYSANFKLFTFFRHEYDTLTLSNVLFGKSDAFQSYMVMAGLRVGF